MDAFSFIFIILVGILLLCVALYHLIEPKRCTMPVWAQYLGLRVCGNRYWYSPVFRYTVGGEVIEQQSFASYSKHKCRKLFAAGKAYTVFVDPSFPRHCIDKRCVPLWRYIVLILTAILFIVMGVLGFLWIATIG